MGVVPSGPGAFGLTPFSPSRRNAVARSPDSAASSKFVAAAAVASEIERTQTAVAESTQRAGAVRILDLRENAAAVADRLHRNVVSIEDRLQQICKARILGILQMLSALDATVRMAKQSRRQRIVVMAIAVAHVAAEQNRGVIQHGAVSFFRRFDPLDESSKHFR